MKTSIQDAFRRADQEGRRAFIPYLTAGFPDEETSLELFRALVRAGADVIEIGLPFSDPMADGPTIQRSSNQALEQGMTPTRALALASRLASETSRPLVVMTYLNPVLKMGYEKFAQAASESGISGAIIPDLPPEEAEPWLEAAGEAGLETIFLAAPTTPFQRLKKIASLSRGFLYYVSQTGVTGTEVSVTAELTRALDQARRVSNLPVAVGFGVGRPEQAAALAPAADGVIVGSALIGEVFKHPSAGAQIEAVEKLAGGLGRALRVNGLAGRKAS